MLTKVKKMMMVGLMATSLTGVAQAAGPLEDGTNACGVPICNATETLTALKAVDSDKRGDWAMRVKAKYAKSQNTEVLSNLYGFGKDLETLYRELSDNPENDWVLREARAVLNNAVLGLSKYSAFDAEKFATYYGELANQNARYDMVSYWQGKGAKSEDVELLNGLIRFATAARTISVELGDDAWVARAATELINTVTVLLVALDPAHEGLYEVVLGSDFSGFPFNKITVLESSSSKNLIVSFVNTKHKQVVYSFKNAEIDGNVIRGEVISNSANSTQFEIVLDRSNGAITGYVSDTLNETTFAGFQAKSTSSVFAGSVDADLNADSVVGEFTGKVLGLDGTLTVKYRESKKLYVAVFKTVDGELNIPFAGKFYPKNGVLSLTHNDSLKLVISKRNGSWKGFTFSTQTGTAVDVEFTK